MSVLKEIAVSKKYKPPHVALSWLLSKLSIISLIVGVAQAEQHINDIHYMNIILNNDDVAVLV
ncbi:hypothetical protein [Xenorhabdus mauleonii]|uniref:hypothetical protein n=1 Tax=Xenorhabdus mauleonii TaxID=351675 RepID=UPI003B849EF4